MHEMELYEGKMIANVLKKIIFESTFSKLMSLKQQCFFSFCFLLVTSGMLAQS